MVICFFPWPVGDLYFFFFFWPANANGRWSVWILDGRLKLRRQTRCKLAASRSRKSFFQNRQRWIFLTQAVDLWKIYLRLLTQKISFSVWSRFCRWSKDGKEHVSNCDWNTRSGKNGPEWIFYGSFHRRLGDIRNTSYKMLSDWIPSDWRPFGTEKCPFSS